MKLGIVMPLWKREELTRLTLRRCARETANDPDCVLVAVTDEAVNGAEARVNGFEVVPHPNSPLSNKKNAGVKHLEGRVDAVVFLGSDDWPASIGAYTFLEAYRHLLGEHPGFGPLDMWYFDRPSRQAGHSPGYPPGPRCGEPIGAGRALRSDALDSIGWLPRPPGLAKNHDGAMRRKLRDAGFEITGFLQAQMGVRIVDIKSELSITPYGKLPNMAPCPPSTVFEPFPEDEVAVLLAEAPVPPPPPPPEIGRVRARRRRG